MFTTFLELSDMKGPCCWPPWTFWGRFTTVSRLLHLPRLVLYISEPTRQLQEQALSLHSVVIWYFGSFYTGFPGGCKAFWGDCSFNMKQHITQIALTWKRLSLRTWGLKGQTAKFTKTHYLTCHPAQQVVLVPFAHVLKYLCGADWSEDVHLKYSTPSWKRLLVIHRRHWWQ